MSTLVENIDKLREHLKQIATVMTENGISIDENADLETICQNLSNPDPIADAITALEVLSGADITGKSLSGLSRIRMYGLFRHNGIQNLTLPDCTEIGSYACQGCTSLSWVKAPNLKTLGTYAFADCTAFAGFNKTSDADVNLIDAIESVGNYAFSNCTSLRTVIVSSLDVFDGSKPFYGCTNIRRLTVQTPTDGKASPSAFLTYPWELPSGCSIVYNGTTFKVS